MIADFTGGVTDAEARRNRRVMRLAVPPAIVGVAVAARNNPWPSVALAGMTASVMLGVMIAVHPGGPAPHDTTPGVIAGQQPPAPITEEPPPMDLRRPEAAPPVSIRPEPAAPAPQVPPRVQTVDLTRVPVPKQPVDGAPMGALRGAEDERPCVVDLDLRRVARLALLCRDGKTTLTSVNR